ncbi:hypothetical protein LCGC14_0862670 [marine sediment metagenome]|uniref:VRR-NUC domain-containing protein n=1 Tax=marine sediment metagenome TaxID=412755 RepID=A0A0F9P6W0_9ZZZZ
MDKKIQGKKNRAAGTRFERKVREDLESKGWIVSKWMNNVGLQKENSIDVCGIPAEGGGFIYGKLIPAKHRFRGPGIPMSMGTGFPDFVAISENWYLIHSLKPLLSTIPKGLKIVYGIEVKSNGYLDKEEKEKCMWLLKKNIFSNILIASKGEKRGEIKYKEVKHGN